MRAVTRSLYTHGLWGSSIRRCGSDAGSGDTPTIHLPPRLMLKEGMQLRGELTVVSHKRD